LFKASRWLRTSAALAGCAVVGTVVAGCGAASATPAGGSQSSAAAFAGKVLDELRLPPGTSTMPAAQVPAAARNPWAGEAGAVDRSRIYTVPSHMPVTETYLLTHSPADAYASGSGTEQGPHGAVVSQWVYFHIGTLPSGVSDADLQLYLVPHGAASTLIAAYVHVGSQPARTKAERLAASGVKAVTIRVDGNATQTFTSEPVIANLVATVNALPAAGTAGASSCPGSATDYRLTFEPHSADAAPVIVDSYSCDYDTVTAYGVPQPALSDRSNTVAALAAQLTRTRQYAS